MGAEPVRGGYAASRIGPWPVRHPGNHCPSWIHARRVWDGTLGHLAEQRMDPRMEGVAPLVFLGRLALHVQGCRRCHVTGALDTITPEAWLRQGIGTCRVTAVALGHVAQRRPGRFVAA